VNYYRRYVGDYLRDTARLSMLEHGAYNLLLDYYYADEKPLPADRDELYLMVRAMSSADRKAVDKVLRVYFTEEPDGYHQKRVDHEIEVSLSARNNGKGGGRPPRGFKPEGEPEPEHKPDSKPESKPLTVTGQETELPTGSVHPPASNPLPNGRVRATRKRAALSSLPVDFGISERVREWAESKGHRNLDEHLEAFVSKVKAKGYTYADWDEAFMNAIRSDWAEIGTRNGSSKLPGRGPDWWASNEGIDRKGRELGMSARPSESYADFKQRIFDQLRGTQH